MTPPTLPTPSSTGSASGSTPTDPELGVFDVIDLMTGYQQAAILTAASRLGVFDVAARGPISAEGAAAELGCDPSALAALLDALGALRLLVPAPGIPQHWATTPMGARLTHAGDLRKVAEKEAYFARVWLDLAASVRTGTPRIDAWTDRLQNDPAQCHFFLDALVVLADETGIDVSLLPGVRPGARVVDLGGGLGAYAVPLARAGCTVTLVDLPTVCAWAEERLDAEQAAGRLSVEARDRITLLPADLLAPDALASGQPLGDLAASHDLILVSHLLHDLDDADAARALTVARSLLVPEGRVAVFELPGEGSGLFGPSFDLMMRVETAGRARKLDELVALLQAAELREVAVDPTFALPHGVVLGHR